MAGVRTIGLSLVFALAAGGCGGDEVVGDCTRGEGIDTRAGGGGDQVIQTVTVLGGGPIGGIAVQVDDLEWVTTDADGIATFEGVGSPFSVRLRQTFGEDRVKLWQLVGQTENPLVVPVEGAGGGHVADIRGTVRGLSGGADTEVVVIGRAGGPTQNGIANPDGTYQIEPLFWNGPATQTIELLALEMQLPYPPMHFVASGVATVEANDPDGRGAMLTGIDIELAQVEEALVSGTVVVPASLDEALYPLLAFEFEDGSVGDLTYYATSAPGAFEFTIPLLDGVSPVLGFEGVAPEISSTGRVERRIAEAASDVQLEVAAPVELLEPPTDARIDTRTRLRWRAEPDAAKYVIVANCSEATDDFTIRVEFEWIETTENEACLFLDEDLRGTCSWQVGWLDAGAAAFYRTGVRADELRMAWSLPSWASFR
jgi:hypothetical protein